jgi:hypothetical protein
MKVSQCSLLRKLNSCDLICCPWSLFRFPFSDHLYRPFIPPTTHCRTLVYRQSQEAQARKVCVMISNVVCRHIIHVPDLETNLLAASLFFVAAAAGSSVVVHLFGRGKCKETERGTTAYCTGTKIVLFRFLRIFLRPKTPTPLLERMLLKTMTRTMMTTMMTKTRNKRN